jgi:hypothetical protein
VIGLPRAMPDVFAASEPAQIMPTTLPLYETDTRSISNGLTMHQWAEKCLAHLVEGPDQLLDVLVLGEPVRALSATGNNLPPHQVGRGQPMCNFKNQNELDLRQRRSHPCAPA